MKKKFLTFACFLLLGGVSFISASNVDIYVGKFDPTETGPGKPKSPPHVPSVDIDGFTTTVPESCYGFILELLDENDDLVYTTIITSTTVNLPSTLSGEYQLRLIPNGSNIYFYGYVLF